MEATPHVALHWTSMQSLVMHHVRLQDLIEQADDLELLKQYDRLFGPGPSRPTMPLPKRKKPPLMESKYWTYQQADPEQEKVVVEPERHKKSSKNAPIVPREPRPSSSCYIPPR
jgi:hypothetical protein